MFKSGFITIVGRPNVGKSTLLNSLMSQKLSIVSPKANTTRNLIKGILTTENYQMVFIDTPGEHSVKTALDEYMSKSIRSASTDVDVVLVVLDCKFGINDEDLRIVEKYKGVAHNLVVVVNKTDTTTFEKLYPALDKLNKLDYVKDIVCLSALKEKNVDELLKVIEKLLPEGEKMYPDDVVADKSERFMAGEILREKALYLLDQEIPHGIAVIIDTFTEQEKIVNIDATIICEKDSHKGIIIGKKGAMLKQIATEARYEMEKMLGKKVFLQVFVKIKSDWRNNVLQLNAIGYDKKDI